MKRFWIALLALGCAAESRVEAPAAPLANPRPAERVAFREIDSPAPQFSGQPHLSTTGDGSTILSWLERKDGESGTYSLRFSRRAGGKWSSPGTVVTRDDFFVNWADFPSVVGADQKRLFAHWLQKSGKAVYAYDVRIASSLDNGETWSKSVVPHRDGTKTEHGFVSLVPRGDSVAAIWLDGRKTAGGHGHHGGPMTLRYATIAADGSLSDEAVLDDRVCDCCPTGLAFTDAGPVAVYRDRSDDEIRDISYVRAASPWSKPAPVSADSWKIDGCPVNGPQIDARGSTAVVAWFTSGGGKNRVLASFSNDSGATFGQAVSVDNGSPLGRVDVVLLPDNSALISWIEQIGSGAEVRARRIRPDGTLDEPLPVATSSPARSAGIPRMTLSGNEVLLAWTEPEQPQRIRIAALDVTP